MVILVVVDLRGTVCFRDEARPISQVDQPTVPTFRPVPFVVQKILRVHWTTTFPTGHRGMPFVSTDLPGVVGPGLIPLPVTLRDQTSVNPFVADRQ
jgi:hypothetical protein